MAQHGACTLESARKNPVVAASQDKLRASELWVTDGKFQHLGHNYTDVYASVPFLPKRDPEGSGIQVGYLESGPQKHDEAER